MFQFVTRRLILSLPILWGVATIVFVALRMLPGDPAVAILGDQASAESLRVLRHRLGLDAPLIHQYFDYMSLLLRGDLGRSLLNEEAVTRLIWRNLPYTAELTVGAILVACLFGIPIGMLSAVKRNTVVDRLARIVALMGVATPAFYAGVVLLIVFSLQLGWFPVMGGGEFSRPLDHIRYSALPSVSVGAVIAGSIMRVTRSAILEVLSEEYIRTARSKGLKEFAVLYKHALKNAMIPIITVIGLNMGILLGGVVAIERVFNRPGLGSLLVTSIYGRDYPAIQSTLVIFAVVVVSVNLITDLTYGLLDPRIRYGRKR